MLAYLCPLLLEQMCARVWPPLLHLLCSNQFPRLLPPRLPILCVALFPRMWALLWLPLFVLLFRPLWPLVRLWLWSLMLSLLWPHLSFLLYSHMRARYVLDWRPRMSRRTLGISGGIGMPAEVIVTVGQKGGGGKTTTTMNLAATAADSGAQVLVVDVDPQRSATQYAEAAGERLPFDFTEADLHSPEVLAQLRDLPHDYVFVDTPGALMDREANAALVESATFAVLPYWGDAMGLDPFVNTVHRVVVPSQTPYRVLLNKVRPARTTDWVGGVRRQLEAAGFSCFAEHITDYTHLEDARRNGDVVTQLPKNRLTKRSVRAYRRVFTELQDALTQAGTAQDGGAR